MDIRSRGSIGPLYDYARQKYGRSLTMLAARSLQERVTAGSVVMIATGWPDRPWISPDIAELDGPPGAAVLARALHLGCRAVPLVVIEEQLVRPMSAVLTGAGFRVLPPDQAMAAIDSPSPIHAAAVLPFPAEMDAARAEARRLLDSYQPAALIAIEKGGMNDQGVIHNARGADTSADMAKVDLLFQAGLAEGVYTLGIGDGGNELGMGAIAEFIKENIPYGAQCQCPCGGGLAPATRTDLVIPAAVSNWGGYGVAAALAVLQEQPAVLHPPELEARILRLGADAGLIDGMTGWCNPGADGMADTIHVSVINLLRGVVEAALSPGYLSR